MSRPVYYYSSFKSSQLLRKVKQNKYYAKYQGTYLTIFLPVYFIGKPLSRTSEIFVLTTAISEMLKYLVMMIFPL